MSKITIESLKSISSEEDVQKICDLLSFETGLPLHAISCAFDQRDGITAFWNLSNVPSGFESEYFDAEAGRIDPVMQHCKHQSSPIIWDRSLYVSAGLEGMYETQARYGYKSGISCAVHLGDGSHMIIGLCGEALPKRPAAVQFAVEKMVFVLSMIHERVIEIASSQLAAQEYVSLLASQYSVAARRESRNEAPAFDLNEEERAVLRWMVSDKSAWAIGAIMGLSESKVRYITNSIRKKMGASSRHEVIISALRAGVTPAMSSGGNENPSAGQSLRARFIDVGIPRQTVFREGCDPGLKSNG